MDNDYFGPFATDITKGRGLDFADSVNVLTFRVRNVTATNLTVTLRYAASETPPAGQTAIAADPERSARIDQHGAKRPGRKIGAGRDPFELTLAVAHQSGGATAADPQRSIAIGRQRGHPARTQPVRGVEDGETDAIEPGQAVGGRKPEVAVGSLCDRADGILRQTLGRGPDVVAELSDGEARIEPPQERAGEHHQ